MQTWSIKDTQKLFGFDAWSEGYFGVAQDGRLECYPQRGGPGVPLLELLPAIAEQGLRLPVLLRFQDILTDRVARLSAAFDQARSGRNYQGNYTVVYPIKVNQQCCVVQQILRAQPGRVGLEAGSKPELMAVLAQTFHKNTVDDHETIICNGYKDREYIRLALIGMQLGKRVFIVIEKPDELEFIMEQARELNVQPCLGVRVRLASIAKGRWQNSGGEKSKFGLSASQILKLVDKLKAMGRLSSLKLLHFHMGSQVADLQHIRLSVREAARFYQELYVLGVVIGTIDVGGGLGVDYTGTASTHEFSMNYVLQDYADVVITEIAAICEKGSLPHPEIITESGRALTAHHAVLITNVVDIESVDTSVSTAESDNDYLQRLYSLGEQVSDSRSAEQLIALMEQIESALSDAQAAYISGQLNLQVRATCEQQAVYCYSRIRIRLLQLGADHSLLDDLNQRLADKFFCNFSVFQSVPDVWGIRQLFPVVPLDGLNRPVATRAVVHDLTCDSDGQIPAYVDSSRVGATLPAQVSGDMVDLSQNYCLGIFLVGAYQEILGDMHNLFGDTDSINVVVDKNGGYRLEDPLPGDRVDELLRYVHYDTEQMLVQYKLKLERSGLSDAQKQQYYLELQDGLVGYTYLED